jgi:hypothetical protein
MPDKVGFVRLKEAEMDIVHSCVVTEKDGNYMALCSVCLWAGQDRLNEELARRDGDTHNLMNLTIR